MLYFTKLTKRIYVIRVKGSNKNEVKAVERGGAAKIPQSDFTGFHWFYSFN